MLCQTQWERKNLLHLGQGQVCCNITRFLKNPSWEDKQKREQLCVCSPCASVMQLVCPSVGADKACVKWTWHHKVGKINQVISNSYEHRFCNGKCCSYSSFYFPPWFNYLPLFQKKWFYNARSWHLSLVRQKGCFWVIVKKMNKHRENPLELRFLSFFQFRSLGVSCMS